jgi:hypothetical protein
MRAAKLVRLWDELTAAQQARLLERASRDQLRHAITQSL